MPSTRSQIAKLLEPAPPVESLIAAGFNEELGKSQNTTLLPLDLGSLEAICRLYFPGVSLERLSVSESFLDEPLGFQQVARFSCGTEFRPFQITITQTTSHIDAVKTMVALCSMIYQQGKRDLEAVKDKLLGNYVVKSEDNKLVVWTRWTTAIQLYIPDLSEYYDSDPSVDILALATSLDNALKSHKGTITNVPKAGLDEGFGLPDISGAHTTETIEAIFEYGIHPVRECRVNQVEKAWVVKDDATLMHGNIENAGGRFHSELTVTCHKPDTALKIAFLMAHKSSLWPVRDECILNEF
ncbi:hypothetical protein QBC32DRAFT_234998 [Pseudoneurospora amorphoporcata]|uniref:Uncharacterized protein n=1 Tax=Pseudoneurospora amorphoporcata TaxID=241081 RepID=A0AAN6SHI9_9PEZI|nr:hypothetical protein QBC32DRAFT_234998 [Pseudoneurospora amorphoporcata]